MENDLVGAEERLEIGELRDLFVDGVERGGDGSLLSPQRGKSSLIGFES